MPPTIPVTTTDGRARATDQPQRRAGGDPPTKLLPPTKATWALFALGRRHDVVTEFYDAHDHKGAPAPLQHFQTRDILPAIAPPLAPGVSVVGAPFATRPSMSYILPWLAWPVTGTSTMGGSPAIPIRPLDAVSACCVAQRPQFVPTQPGLVPVIRAYSEGGAVY